MQKLLSRFRAAVIASAVLLTGVVCDDPTAPPPAVQEQPLLHINSHPTGNPAVLVGAGDIGNCVSNNDEATAKLLDGIAGTVMALGDISEIQSESDLPYPRCYNDTWGRHNHRVHAAIGNKDYIDGSPEQYASYFGAAAGPSPGFYYSFDLGEWHIVVLNSNNTFVSTAAGSEQERWLRNDLRLTAKPCVAVLMHHPRFFSSTTGGVSTAASVLKPFWVALHRYGVDLVVSANRHHYERLARMDADGALDPERGIRQFIVGTGGTSLGVPNPNSGSIHPHSEVRGGDFGVLKLTLEPQQFTYEFIPTRNRFKDGPATEGCHESTLPVEVTVASSSSAISHGEAATLTATVTESEGAVPVGTITFIEGGTCESPAAILATAQPVNSAGEASFSSSAFSVEGSPHTITACYQGAGSFMSGQGSAALSVRKADAHVMIADVLHTYTGAPAAATVTTSPVGLSVTVQYRLGEAIVENPVDAGDYTVTATIDDPNYQGTSTVDFRIAQAEQTVTLENIADRVFGDAPFVVYAASSAGLPVDLSVQPTSVCTSLQDKITIVGAGTCRVTAEQPGNRNYLAARAEQAFEVAKAQPVIVWSSPAAITYGTALGDDQLNAAAVHNGSTVPGALTYTPGKGTLLNAGPNQTLSVEFVPQDANNYHPAIASVSISVARASQTIVFDRPADRTYGDTPFTVSARASSELPLRYGATGACSISGDQVSLDGAGTCTLVASQDGDANFEPASDVVQSFTIHKKSVIITLIGLDGHTYDATAKPATVATDPDGIAGLSITYDGSPSPPVDAGEYIVDVTLENPNYVAPPARGVLTIARRPATVVVADQQRIYGDPNPAFTGTVGNLVAADDLSCTYSTPADITASVGGYTIEAHCAEQSGKQNYLVGVTSGTLNVEPAPLSVRADDASITYGDQIPSLTGAVSGLRNNDPISVSFATAASATSPAGSYSIIPQLLDPEGKAGNYSLSVINGNLTIARASLTVTAAAATRAYGDPNPAFTVTYDGFRNGDDESILEGALSFEVNATAESPVGSYLITPQGRSAANYIVMHVAAVLTVTPVPLTVIPDDHERPYGSPNPAFGGSIIGLRNGDQITATYSSSAAESSPVGSYAIEATIADPNGRLTNYLLTVATGTLTVHRADQTITFAALPDATYGDGPVQLTASSTSTQPVTFSAEGSCTVDGTVLTLTSAGMCAVTAQQPGDGNYNAAPAVNRAFAIAKATPVITWVDPEEIPYGVPLGADQLRASATFRGSPLAGSFVYSPAAGTILDIGADQELGVTFTPDDQTSFTTAVATARIDVRKAAQVISFSLLPDRRFGDAPFTVSASASSGLPVSFAVGPADQCALSGNTVTITGAGSCTVTASQEGSVRYDAAPSVSRTFGIAKASQTLVFGGVPAKTFGDAAFDAAAYATISSGLPVSFTSATPDRCTINGSQVVITDVGVDASACTITAIQVGNENYEAVTSSTSFDIRNRIDIYPSTSENYIGWKGSQTQFTVAILTMKNSDGSTIFDASRIDLSTLTMTGPSGTGTVATDNKGNPKVYLRDVDGDRDLDLYAYFYKTDVFTAADVSPTPHVMTWNARLKADTRPVRGFDLLRLDP